MKAITDLTDDELLTEYYNAKHEKEKYSISQLSRKVLLNSCYGATGSRWFSLMDVRVAQATTLCGQGFIRSSGKAIANYITKLVLMRAKQIEQNTKDVKSNVQNQREHIDPIIGGD